MPRPKRFRKLTMAPTAPWCFLPLGQEAPRANALYLRVEELEAIRLADFEGRAQVDAARRMKVSRQTFGRILARGRRTVSEGLVTGRPIVIGGGSYRFEKAGRLLCPHCRHSQPPVPAHRGTIRCRRCCWPVQAYEDPQPMEQQGGRRMESSKVKVAIASDDGRNVTSHFGRAPYYEVITVENGKIAAREQRAKIAHHGMAGPHDGGNGGHAHHHQVHAAMGEAISDCQVVVARGMGDGAYIHLTQSGLTTILTPLHTVQEVAEAFCNGTLQHQPERIHRHGALQR